MDTLLNDILNCSNCSITLCVSGKGLCISHYHRWYVLEKYPKGREIAQLFELLRRKLVDKAYHFANSTITNPANHSQETKAISNESRTHLHIYDKDGNEIKDITKQCKKGWCVWVCVCVRQQNLNCGSSLISNITNNNRHGGTSDITSGNQTTWRWETHHANKSIICKKRCYHIHFLVNITYLLYLAYNSDCRLGD